MARDWRTAFRPIPALLRSQLPMELHDFQWSASSWMAKAWYGNRDLHYEIWVRPSLKAVELGLHFEADALTNARLLGAFRGRAKEIRRELGKDARVQEWDKGWGRVWEPLPFATEDLEERVRTRFCDYVAVLEPMLRDELPGDVPWKIAVPRRGAKAISSRASR